VKKKVKEVIKEENEEKDSLLNEIKYKSQAAMEYLMTYGWAILIIALSLVVLYSLGIMNPKNFIPRAPPGSCFVFRPNGPGTTDFVSLQGTCGYLPMYVASFNGVNSYVRTAQSSFPTGGNPVTYIAWVYLNDYRSYGNVIVGFRWADDTGILLSNGYLSFRLLSSTDNQFHYCQHPNRLALKKWYFVAGEYNNGNIYLYLNNVNSSCLNTGWTPRGSPYKYIIIGATDIAYYCFNGSISNAQMYSAILTPQEIQYLYQQGLGGGPVRLQNLVGWWPLNGDAKDYSGNNNHGTIYNVTFVQNYNPP